MSPVSTDDDDLPFVDEHATVVAGTRDQVWEALERYADGVLARAADGTLSRLLGDPEPAGREPGQRLSLVGRHRFSRYRLEFLLDDVGVRTRLRARTLAVFPGLHGQVYKTLVIRSRLHVLAVRRMLRQVGTAIKG